MALEVAKLPLFRWSETSENISSNQNCKSNIAATIDNSFQPIRQKNVLKLCKYGERHAKISPNLRKMPLKGNTSLCFLLLS